MRVVARAADYPFDRQDITLRIGVDGAYLMGCNGTGLTSPALAGLGLTDENADELLLPPTGEWYIPDSIDKVVHVSHPLDDNGEPKLDECVLVISAQRNPQVFLFRSLATTVIVVFGSLLTALAMHPEEHSGDRAAVLFIAFLISLTNMASTDLGLGRVSELLWVDMFNLQQLVLSIVGVGETVVVHMLFSRNQPKFGTHVDSVCRRSIPILYVTETLGLFLYGNGERSSTTRAVAIAIMVTAFVFLVPLTLLGVWITSTAERREQTRAVAAMLELDRDRDGKKWDRAMKEVFAAFDTDKSGEMDIDEIRELFEFMHPGLSRDTLSECVNEMRKYADVASGTLTSSMFVDALIKGEELLLRRLELEETSSRSPHQSRLSGRRHSSQDTDHGEARPKEGTFLMTARPKPASKDARAMVTPRYCHNVAAATSSTVTVPASEVEIMAEIVPVPAGGGEQPAARPAKWC